MQQGFCIIEVLFDEANQPVDYRFLETNPGFEKLTGLPDAVGKTMRELEPNHEAHWFRLYGQVVATGQAVHFENPAAHLNGGVYYEGYAFPAGAAGSHRVAILFADTTGRKKAEQALRASHARQAFLLQLSDALRFLADPLEIQRTAMRVLGEALQVDRVMYGEMDEAETAYVIADNYVRGAHAKTVGRFPTSSFAEFTDWSHAGRPAAVADVAGDERLSDSTRAALIALNVHACVNVSLLKGNRWVANLGVHHAAPRQWTAEEIELVQETAERTWAAVERAKAEEALRLLTASLEGKVARRTAQLQESRDLLQSVFDVSLNSLSLLKAIRNEAGKVVDFQWVLANQAEQERVNRGSLAGKRFTEMYPGTEAARWLQRYADVVAQDHVADFEDSYVLNGSRQWFHVLAQRYGDGLMVASSVVTERKKAEAALTADLAGMQRLHQLHGRLAAETNLDEALTQIVALACDFLETDRGCIQLVSDDGERLQMQAYRGFEENNPFIRLFRYEGSKAACDLVRRHRKRMLFEDLENMPALAGTRDLDVCLSQGMRASQSTPLFNRKGELVGVLSNQFREPHRPSEQQLNLIDLLAWAAADFIERHQATEALRQSEQRFRRLVESYAQAVWETTAEGVVVLDSPSWRAYTGQTVEEWRGDGWVNAVHPDDRANARRQWREAVEAKGDLDAEFRLRYAPGGYRWTHVRATPIVDAEGIIRKWVGMNLDIEERKRAAEEVKKNLSLLQQSEAIAPMGSWEYDFGSGAFTWSEGMYRLFGLLPGTPVRPEIYLDYVLEEDRLLAQKIVQALRQTHEPLEETLRIGVNGKATTLKIKAQVLPDGQGGAGKILGVDLDISQIKRLEEENIQIRLQQQQQLLNAILDAQEEERRRISESLHNGVGQLLFATKLNLAGVQLDAPPKGKAEATGALQKAEALLTEAIEETRRASHELVPILLKEFGLEKAIGDFCRRFDRTGIALDCHCFPERLSPSMETAVYRIGQELISNIVKHSGATRANLEVSKDKDFVYLDVQDNGKGMPPDKALGRDSLVQQPGRGIGLRTIQDRVSLLGGTLQIESTPGKGTSIAICLPVGKDNQG